MGMQRKAHLLCNCDRKVRRGYDYDYACVTGCYTGHRDYAFARAMPGLTGGTTTYGQQQGYCGARNGDAGIGASYTSSDRLRDCQDGERATVSLAGHNTYSAGTPCRADSSSLPLVYTTEECR